MVQDNEAPDRLPQAVVASASHHHRPESGTSSRRHYHQLPQIKTSSWRWLPGGGAAASPRPATRAVASTVSCGGASTGVAPSKCPAGLGSEAGAPNGVRGPWLIFAVTSIALFMSSLDGTIVSTGLPTLRHALHSGINWTSWTMTAYQLGLVVAMPIAGRVADSLGRKRVFLGAAVLFTTSSLLCGLSSNIDVLIALRVAQAAGGAAFLPAASGIVTEAFGARSQRALGLFSSIFPLGALVGPIAGGIILATWSWRGMFLVNVPIGTTFTLLAWKWLPSSPRRDGRADVAGALLMGGGVLGLMLAITDLGNRTVGLRSPSFVLPLAISVICGWLFVRHCDRVPSPLVPRHLLRGRTFVATNLVNLVWGACVIGFGSLVPLYAEDRYHLTPLASGTLLTSRAVGEIVLAICASVLIYRTGYRLPIIAGMGLIGVALAMLATTPVLFSPYVWLAVGSTISGFGTGLSAPAANNASIELAPDDVGAITGLRGAARQGGAILGISLVTSVAAHTGHEVAALQDAFFILAAMLVCMVPLVFIVPESARRRGRGIAKAGPHYIDMPVPS